VARKGCLRYARRVKRGPRIELPDKRGDELPVRSLIAVSIACMAAGLSVAYAVTERRGSARDEQRVAHEPAAPTASVEASDAAVPPVAIEAEPEFVGPPVAQTIDAGQPEPEPIAQALEPTPVDADESVAAAPPPTGPPPMIAPGVFAYLRCEGLPQRRGPFPCPRDRGLETRIREIVETLPSCRKADEIVRGSYDVRLELGPTGAVQDLAVRAPNDAAEHAVRACAAAQLRRERTELKPTRMIVSVRFKAR